MREVIGNLIITNLSKYLERSNKNFLTSHCLRQSVIDICEGKTFLNEFSFFIFYFLLAASLRASKELIKLQSTTVEGPLPQNLKDDDGDDDAGKALVTNHERKVVEGTIITNWNESINPGVNARQPLTAAEKFKQKEMEKNANWWTKYYASKAKRVCLYKRRRRRRRSFRN